MKGSAFLYYICSSLDGARLPGHRLSDYVSTDKVRYDHIDSLKDGNYIYMRGRKRG